MKRFHKLEYIITPREIINHAFTILQLGGNSTILDDIAMSNREFEEYLELLIDELQFLDNPELTINDAIDKFNLLTYDISDKALLRDKISRYNWTDFWDSVSHVFGGIEFLNDIFDIKQWEDIPIIWTSKIEVHSGVIFNPVSFRGGIIPVLQAGGRCKTRRRGRKNKKLSRKDKRYN